MKINHLIFISFLLWSCTKDSVTQKSPNIILILADDMGYTDLGCTGSEIPTPNLDKLAADGMFMPNFYNAARCCPTRASLLTGLYPHEVGMGDMVEGRLLKDSTFLPSYQGWLEKNKTTIAEALKKVGYNTYISGKWHVGNDPENWPDSRGFDRTFAMIHGASNYFNMEPWISDDQFSRLHLDGKPYEPEDSFYMTTAITDHAINFIEEKKDESQFFLYLPYTAPHWPLHALQEDIEKFKGKYMSGWETIRQNRFQKMKELNLLPQNYSLPSPYFLNQNVTPDWDSLDQSQKEIWDLRMAVYAAQVYRMDQEIGKLIDYLKEKNQLDNTIIMFLSDNGATQAGIYQATGWVADRSGPIGSAQSFDSYGASWANVSNVPYRLFKHWTTEGGIKTPFILYWPEKIKKGIRAEEYGHIIDLMPTCLSAAGIDPGEFGQVINQPLEGLNLLQGLQDNLPDDRVLYWEHQNSWAVRKGPWKLVSVPSKNSTSKAELINLDEDPGETKDLSDQYPKIANELKQLYKSWAEKVGVVDFDSTILAKEI